MDTTSSPDPGATTAASPIPVDRITELYRGDIFTEETARVARDRIHWMCAQCEGARVLDVGCSQGIAAILLAREGFEVTAIDTHPESLAFARREIAREGRLVQDRLTLIETDLASLPEQADYDTILLGEVIEHQAVPIRLLRAARARLKPSGRMVVTTPFALHPHVDHKVSLFPRDLASFAAQLDMALTALHVDGNYMRCVLSDRVHGQEPIELDTLSSLTEAATLQSQRQLYDRLADRLEALKKRSDALKSAQSKLAEATSARQLAITTADDAVAAERGKYRDAEARLGASESKAAAALQAMRDAEARLAAEERKRVDVEARLAAEERKRVDVEARLAAEDCKRVDAEARVAAEERKRVGVEARLAAEERKHSAMEAHSVRTQVGLAAAQHELSQARGQADHLALQGTTLLKRLVAQERAVAESERRRQRVEQQLALRIGRVIVACRRAPQRLLLLPLDLIRELRAYRRERRLRSEAPAAVASDGRTGLLGERWNPVSMLVKREAQWLRVPVAAPGLSLQVGLRLESFDTATNAEAMLLAQFRASDGKIISPVDTRRGAAASVPASLVLPLSLGNVGDREEWIDLPDGCSEVALTVNRGASANIARVVYTRLALHPHSSRSTHSVAPAASAKPTPSDLPLRPDDPPRPRALSLLDPFSHACFAPDLTLIPLDREGWKEQLDGGIAYDFFFAESVWRGNDGTWNYCMTKPQSSAGEALQAVLSRCRELGIPSVLWNKEDPANFDVFLEAARRFDIIFTTDANCVPRYRAEVGHDRVHVLPFAAQPHLHNPVLPGDRQPRVAFAGSWNGNKYPARARWLEVLLGAAMSRGVLDIFDRHADEKDAALRFPERFRSAVRGAVPYDEIAERVYKRYGAMLNVNSVEDSPSMVARRVFELAACGTPLISSPSPALEGAFADVVTVVQNESDAGAAIDQALGDELATLRRAVRGVRLVHAQHTYGHRVKTLVGNIGLGASVVSKAEQPITAICVSRRPQYVGRVAAMLGAQTHGDVRVLFVAHGEGFDDETIKRAFAPRLRVQVLHLDGTDTVLADGLNLAMSKAETDLLAKIDDDDYYGPNYLLDATLGFGYSDAGVVGKGSYFCYVEHSDQMGLRFPSQHYRPRSIIHGGTLVWDRRRTKGLAFSRVRQGCDTAFLRSLKEHDVSILSIDPFNFVHVRYANAQQHTWKIEDEAFMAKARILRSGLDLDLAYA
jgi:2-polyprenyl-3-methyl-5-hydroxy-6-metoxy-1,4-benzoquinol methylase/spore maturation protein CgeB